MSITSVNSVGSGGMTPVYSGFGGGERAAHDSGAQAIPAAVTPSAQSDQGGDAPVGDAELEKIMETPIAQANKALKAFDRQIEREIHEVTKTLMYKIRDTKTNEVIAEYPPKKIQDMIAKMWELAGLFIDQKA